MLNGGELNASGFGGSIVKVPGQPKRQAWVVSKYEPIRKSHSTIPPGKK